MNPNNKTMPNAVRKELRSMVAAPVLPAAQTDANTTSPSVPPALSGDFDRMATHQFMKIVQS
jgi:hypothetical protein